LQGSRQVERGINSRLAIILYKYPYIKLVFQKISSKWYFERNFNLFRA